eukprot:TRINITY_DN22655_c0_g2_i2.p1 TRINITY_DN22655_c0_g2~~TRINITY_DN22655_c0_g2_i2.p1  ORF type:complete len:355 (-),score=74.69 TRINITY_DN22655_c0_g2_i2:89-1153(-)
MKDKQCKRCKSSRMTGECVLCPRRGGAFKPTSESKFVHVACALWMPEVNPLVVPYRLGNIKKLRFQTSCSLCGKRKGACIQCGEKKCPFSFHVTCALISGCCSMELYSRSGQVLTEPVAFCWQHSVISNYRVSVPNSFSRLVFLRRELDKARTVLDLVRRREKLKKSLATVEVNIFEQGPSALKARDAWIEKSSTYPDIHSFDDGENVRLLIRRASISTKKKKRSAASSLVMERPVKRRRRKSVPEPISSTDEEDEEPSPVIGKFQVGDDVYVLQDPIYYPARVLQVSMDDEGDTVYLIHYYGWNSKHDEVVGEDLMMAVNKENDKKAQDLARKHGAKLNKITQPTPKKSNKNS